MSNFQRKKLDSQINNGLRDIHKIVDKGHFLEMIFQAQLTLISPNLTLFWHIYAPINSISKLIGPKSWPNYPNLKYDCTNYS